MQKKKALYILLIYSVIFQSLILIIAGCTLWQNDPASHTGGLPPRTFNLLYPPNGATNVGLTPTFQWEPSIDPERESVQYTVHLRLDNGWTKLLTTSQTSYTLTTPLQAATLYYWQVEAVDAVGNTKKTPYYSFTTGTGQKGGGGGGGGNYSFQTLGGFSQSQVYKGVVLYNSAYPHYLLYLYIQSTDLKMGYRESFDGGASWGSPVSIIGPQNARDMAAALGGNGTAVALIMHDANDAQGTDGKIIYTTHPYNGSWATPIQLDFVSAPGRIRLPSTVPTTGNEHLFAYAYDTLGQNFENDTFAYSIQWTGSAMTTTHNIGLHSSTYNPVICQQLSYDHTSGHMYYLYYDDHQDNESDGGDIFVIKGDYPNTWFGSTSEVRVVNAGDSQRPGQGYLFRGNGGDFILVYALEVGPVGAPTGNTLYMKHAATLAALEIASPITLEPSLKVTDDTFARYRTVYAMRDSAGHVHVVFQDQSNNIKCVKINSNTYTVEQSVTLATGQWLDSISLSGNKLYVSTISDVVVGNSASIIEVSF